MKKISVLALAIIAFSLASCNKNRTCTCTYTNTGSSSVDTRVTTYNDVTKKSAEANCTSGTSFDPYDSGKVQMRNCELN
jgi:hypothetical protein